MKKRKILAILLVLAMALPLVAACGCEEEIRYTITEEEWNASQSEANLKNVTVKQENYDGDENNVVLVKFADGYTCSCDGEKWWENNQDNTSVTVIKSEMTEEFSGSNVTIDVSDLFRSAEAESELVFGGNTIVDNKEATVEGENIGEGWTPIGSIPNVTLDDLTNGSSSSVIQIIGLKSAYYDKEGKKYTSKYNTINATNSVGMRCTKVYEDKHYVEILVEDENGNEVVKWAEDIGTLYAELKKEDIIPFSDLIYDEEEKAYVYERDVMETYEEYEEMLGIDLDDVHYGSKIYFYFENGKLIKTVDFGTPCVEMDEKPYDLSNVKPTQLVSDDYYATVYKYYNYGETEIEHHSFSKNDIVTQKTN